jgi:hypothetical protein
MDLAQVEKQHHEGLAKLGILYSQSENLDNQIKDLKSQLLQLEAIKQFSVSSQSKSTGDAVAPESPE